MASRLCPAKLSVTRAPASLPPVSVVPCSLAFNTSSPATASIVGAPGATVSSVKSPPLPAVLALPAASVTVVDTRTSPWPRVCTSCACSVSACHVPAPTPLRVTVPPVPVIVTVQAAPASVRTWATPSAAVASAALTTVPAAEFCRLASGATVSTWKLRLAAGLVLPAASVWVTVTVSGPWPMAARSAAVSA